MNVVGALKRKWSPLRVLSSDSEDDEGTLASLSSSDSEAEDREDEDHQRRKAVRTFKIPRREAATPWTEEELENFRKNWPHLKNFSDSVLKHATLSELTGMARQRVSGSKILSQKLSANYEQILNFPEKVEGGGGSVHRKSPPRKVFKGLRGGLPRSKPGKSGGWTVSTQLETMRWCQLDWATP